MDRERLRRRQVTCLYYGDCLRYHALMHHRDFSCRGCKRYIDERELVL
jgi:hypothetical protein